MSRWRPGLRLRLRASGCARRSSDELLDVDELLELLELLEDELLELESSSRAPPHSPGSGTWGGGAVASRLRC